MRNHRLFLLLVLLLAVIFLNAQKATITEESRTLKTYPFSDPDLVPILTSNPKIYPYFKYDGYSHESKQQDWKVVKLENEYVELFVLPEVGGKVWGAIEKSTGEEFIYRNEVMKFRNISMRGPWTSGGIEFNFGIIGHHPSTATPVDYVVEENEDGSVTCTVGNIDLPSRTQWRVKIILPKDKAAFETEALWYNPTPMNQSYYNWMTGAAPARSDFEFFTPGDEYLEHSGEAKPWAIDNMGRDLSLYKENNFGPSKSYHVVGSYNDFFGGYYHDAKYGFGHWGEYEAIPGQKLWLWDLSRSGGIWEDLLTDTDGQYIEFQAGRQFLQYSPGGHENPQSQANFEPYSADNWREVWFPIKEIGGMSDVSESAVMNVEIEDGHLKIGINPFIKKTAILEVISDGKVLHNEALSLQPMDVFIRKIDLKGATNYEVKVSALELNFTSDPNDRLIERPFHSDGIPVISSNEKLYKAGWEDMKYRLYSKAKTKFKAVLKTDPFHIDALLGLGELYYRQGLYDKGLHVANKALQLDTYDPSANYIAGILYRGKGDNLNAKESLGWAARSMEYRSNAYAQIAEILVGESDFSRAEKYAQKALNFNQFNINAWQVKAIVARKNKEKDIAASVLEKIEDIDPLNHFAKFENYLLKKGKADLAKFTNAHRSELAYQTYLELAIDYYNKGLAEEASQVLEIAPLHPIINLWKAFIQKDAGAKYFKSIGGISPELVFPFRRETLAALDWGNQNSNHWKLKYYLALNLWGKDRIEEAAKIMQAIGNQPNYAPFYIARASFLEKNGGLDPLADLKKAQQLNQKDWRNWRALINYYNQKGDVSNALNLAEKANQKFPDNYAVGMDYAQILNQSKQYEGSIKALGELNILPFEGASAGRKLYENAHYGLAMNLMKNKDYKSAISILEKAKEWPENLGVGKPFEAEERIPNYLLAYCHDKLGNRQKAVQLWQQISAYTTNHLNQPALQNILGLRAMQNSVGLPSAKLLLQTMLNSKNGDKFSTQWAAAHFLKNKQKEEQLIKQNREKSMSDKFLLIKGMLEL